MKKRIDNKVTLSDQEIVELITKYNHYSYFGIIYDRYAQFVYNKCYAFVENEEEAKDLTHDIFIKIFLKLTDFKGKSKFSTWLYAITFNSCVNYVNKNKKQKFYFSDDYLVEESEEDTTNEELNQYDLFEISYTQLQQILNTIPPTDKMILIMKYQEDLSIKEISEILNVKLSAVKMRLSRAKQKVLDLHK